MNRMDRGITTDGIDETARRRFLDEHRCKTDQDLRDIGIPSEKAAIGLRTDGGTLYPAFQFRGLRVHPVVEEACGVLRDRLDGWGMALWYTSPNPALKGMTPLARIEDRKILLDAARRGAMAET